MGEGSGAEISKIDPFNQYILLIQGFLFPAITHEISSVLSNIKLCSDYLQMTDSREKQKRLAGEIGTQVSGPADELLTLMKTIYHHSGLEKKPLCIPKDFSLLFKLLRSSCKRYEVSLHTVTQRSCTTCVDGTDLFLALGELLLFSVMNIPSSPEANREITLSIDKNNNLDSLTLFYSPGTWSDPGLLEMPPLGTERGGLFTPWNSFVVTPVVAARNDLTLRCMEESGVRSIHLSLPPV
jgi:hypothetical protein